MGLKAYIGILLSLTLANDILHVCVTEFSLVFHADSMLGTLNKKDFATRAKFLKVVAQAPPAEDLKLKAVAEVDLLDDKETCSGPVFKRRRKADPTPTEHSASDGRAPSPQVPPPSHFPRNIMVQESMGENLRNGGLWDPSLDAPSFLGKTLLPTEAREELDNLEDDQLMGQTVR